MKAKETPVPQACIRRSSNGYTVYTYCNREIEQREHYFNDVKRAVLIYANSPFLRACPCCVTNALKEGATNDGETLAPISTRGLKNDR